MSKKLMWVVAVCLGLASLAAAGGERGVVCQSAIVNAAVDQWKELPKDYASFAALPEEYKKAVYLRLADAERAALWQAHWQNASEAAGLGEDQRGLLAEAGRLFTADTFAALRAADGLHYPATRQLAREFETRLQAFFDKKEMTALFGRIGPVRAQNVLAAEPDAEPFAARQGKPLSFLPLCSCNLAYNDCGFGLVCGTSSICVPTGGCGYMMMEDCDGACRNAGPPDPCP